MPQHVKAVFEQLFEEQMIRELADYYAQGDAALIEEFKKVFGSKSFELVRPSPEKIRNTVLEFVQPVSDWNKEFAGFLLKYVNEYIRIGYRGKDLNDVLSMIRPEKLKTDIVEIQRPGKKPYRATPQTYLQLISRTIPAAVRNVAYIERAKKVGVYSGWKSICPADERSCEECVSYMRESEENPFTWDHLLPPYHPNCRCRPLAVTSSEDIAVDNIPEERVEEPPKSVEEEERKRQERQQALKELMDRWQSKEFELKSSTPVILSRSIWRESNVYPDYDYHLQFEDLPPLCAHYTSKLPPTSEFAQKPEDYYFAPFWERKKDGDYTYIHAKSFNPDGLELVRYMYEIKLRDGIFDGKDPGDPSVSTDPQTLQRILEFFGVNEGDQEQFINDLKIASLKGQFYLEGMSSGLDLLIEKSQEEIKDLKKCRENVERLRNTVNGWMRPLPEGEIRNSIVEIVDEKPARAATYGLPTYKENFPLVAGDFDSLRDFIKRTLYQITDEEIRDMEIEISRRWLNGLKKSLGDRADESLPLRVDQALFKSIYLTYTDPAIAARDMPVFTKYFIQALRPGGVMEDEITIRRAFSGAPYVDMLSFSYTIKTIPPTTSLINEFPLISQRDLDTSKRIVNKGILEDFGKEVPAILSDKKRDFVTFQEGLLKNNQAYGQFRAGRDGRSPSILLDKDLCEKKPKDAFASLCHEYAHAVSYYMPGADGKPRLDFIDPREETLMGFVVTEPGVFSAKAVERLMNNLGCSNPSPELRETVLKEMQMTAAYVRQYISLMGLSDEEKIKYISRFSSYFDRVNSEEFIKRWGKIDITGEDKLERELSLVLKRNPHAAILNAIRQSSSGQVKTVWGDVTPLDIPKIVDMVFPPSYSPEAKEDIAAYIFMQWVTKADEGWQTLYNANMAWAGRLEEHWAMFIESIAVDAGTTKRLAPTTYSLFVQNLKEGMYGKALPELLGFYKTAEEISAPREFVTGKEAASVFEKYFKQKLSELTPEQKSSMEYYKGSGYSPINHYLRGTQPITLEAMKSVNKEIKNIMDGLQPIPADVKVYRGFSAPEINKFWDVIEGGTFTDPGFMSTSLKEESAKKFYDRESVIAEIIVPRGTHGYYLETISAMGEDELLLPPGSVLRVTGKEEMKDGTRKIYMILEIDGKTKRPPGVV